MLLESPHSRSHRTILAQTTRQTPTSWMLLIYGFKSGLILAALVTRIRGFTTMRYINLRFTYLLTYLRECTTEKGIFFIL